MLTCLCQKSGAQRGRRFVCRRSQQKEGRGTWGGQTAEAGACPLFHTESLAGGLAGISVPHWEWTSGHYLLLDSSPWLQWFLVHGDICLIFHPYYFPSSATFLDLKKYESNTFSLKIAAVYKDDYFSRNFLRCCVCKGTHTLYTFVHLSLFTKKCNLAILIPNSAFLY